jgi:hypothetical protein
MRNWLQAGQDVLHLEIARSLDDKQHVFAKGKHAVTRKIKDEIAVRYSVS